jgi:7-cyano-7-deazaguanine synthase
MKSVCLFSGGLDSTTLAYLLRDQHSEVHLVSIYYGQRHKKEIESARKIAELMKVPWQVIDISEVGKALTGSALTDPSVPVPHGHYEDKSMKSTVVPNRNAILLTIASGIAASIGATRVGTAVHAGDHYIYPDCRPDFIRSLQVMEMFAFGDMWPHVQIYTPFLKIPKGDIVRIGTHLGVPYNLTWSCYEGGDKHCGKCGTCVERREAFQLAGVPDPTEYEA